MFLETVLFFLGLTLAAALFFGRGSGKSEETGKAEETKGILRKSLAGRELFSLEEYLPGMLLSIVDERSEDETWKVFAVMLRSSLTAAMEEKAEELLLYDEIGLESENTRLPQDIWTEEKERAYEKAKKAAKETENQVLQQKNGLCAPLYGEGSAEKLEEADKMAKCGSTYTEILHSFFPDYEIIKN